MEEDFDCGEFCLFCCQAYTARIIRWTLIIAVVLTGVLVPAFGVVQPVHATVKDASLSSVALAGANGTELAYDLALTLALRNDNWAMRAEHAAPLEAELRFAGQRLDGARLVGAGAAMRRIEPRRTEEFRVLAVSSRGVALGGGAAAEFARQSVAGVLELELKLAGAFRYRPVHVGGSRRLEVTCPVRLQMAAAPSGTHLMMFDKVISCY